MYEKKFIFISIIFILFVSCKSTKVLPDNGTGVAEYRELESEIRIGEAELASTSSGIESTSERIEQSLVEIKDTSERIEQSITESTDNESKLREIIQRIRERKLTENQLADFGIEIQE